MIDKLHWQSIYSTKKPGETSWFQPKPIVSLRLIENTGMSAGEIIDVGSGASMLVDDLLKKNFKVTVLDISEKALEASKTRLGEASKNVEWIISDIREAKLGSFDIWHDRALFHFLVDSEDRKKYIDLMKASLNPNGQAIIATFDLTGPEKCSGLPIIRYSSESLQRELGQNFELVESVKEAHSTPSGNVQNFVYCRFKFYRTPSPNP